METNFTGMWFNRFHRILNSISYSVYFSLSLFLQPFSLFIPFGLLPLSLSLSSMKWDHVTSVVQLASEICCPSHQCLCGEPDRCGQPESSELGERKKKGKKIGSLLEIKNDPRASTVRLDVSKWSNAPGATVSKDRQITNRNENQL